MYIFFFFIYILLYSGAKKSNNSRIVTRHQFACTPPWKRKPDTELAWETTSQEESSPCTAGPRENRHSSALGKASPAKHGARAGPWGSMCCCSDKHREAPASAPSLQPRHSRAPLGRGSCCCFTQHCPAVTSHPSSCAGSSCSSACAEVRAQLHVWFRQWIHGRWGCEVPSTALAAVM